MKCNYAGYKLQAQPLPEGYTLPLQGNRRSFRFELGEMKRELLVPARGPI